MTDAAAPRRANRVEEINARAEAATLGPWESPLRNLGDVKSFAAVDFYFDESYEAYPPLGESGPVFVTPTRENADFLAHAREDIPWLLAELAERDAALASAAEPLEILAATECDEAALALSPPLKRLILDAVTRIRAALSPHAAPMSQDGHDDVATDEEYFNRDSAGGARA